ncbi:hypothetical protein N7520_000941 [Penicillium odoratum]|uniref:uncharacterized protein n=1 Tax=Penicillium odoratum TaxID=1167516 RepID=UPI002548CF83|nr:uncharacterized protein N7520_000941 [Penicillium odoratum]KAJ5777695.1 hypothetical protein N7520_000941 [Penicillium odoratum]
MQFSYQMITTFMAFVLFNSATAAPAVDAVDAVDEVNAAANGRATWADPQDCHRFFECPAGEKPVLKTCGPGTAFQASTGVCDYEYNVASCWHH